MKVEKVTIYGQQHAVFSVCTRNKIVFMKKAIFQTEVDDSFIVLVERIRFESVWFKCGDRVAPTLARGNELIWRSDEKFHFAEKGFGYGVENPVPLACMSASSAYPQVSFVDGITRTIWLMANGVGQFPVLTHSFEEARNLHRYIGVKASSIISNNELLDRLNQYSCFEM